MGRRVWIAVGMLLALAGSAQGQDRGVTITGRVVDADTGAPLPGAHVFVAQSMVGTTTAPDGTYRLSKIPRGAVRLYVSMLGYEASTYPFHLPRDTTVVVEAALAPTVLQAEGVVVEAERDKAWYKRLRKFTRWFIGESDLAEQCALLNPEALQFDTSWWGRFEARAVEPLIIENRALGYRVTYFLEEFQKKGPLTKWDGEPLFEPLTPRDRAEAVRWAENRRQAFRGSMRHFLQALLADRVREEGFIMRRIPRASVYRNVGRADRFPVRRSRILASGPDSTHLLDFRGRLEVTYVEEPESDTYLRWTHTYDRRPARYQTSHIRLNDPPVHVDRHGEIVEPYGATVYAYFSFEMRLAELLPVEYQPGDAAAAQ